jgi:hypothetical protein
MPYNFEDTLHNLYLGGGGFEPAECRPVIHNEPSTNHITSPVDGPGTEGNLHQIGQFIEFLNGGLRVNQSSLVVEHRVGPYERVLSHCRPEDLNPESIADDLL